MNLFDDAGFDDPTVLLIEERQQDHLYGGARSTPQTRERYASLRTKRAGDVWQHGRFLYRYGRTGVTVYDTGKW